MPFKDILAIVIMVFFLGFNFIAVKLAVTEIPLWTTLALRLLLVALILVPFFPFPRGKLLDIFFLSLVFAVLHLGSLFWALEHTQSTGIIAVIAQTAPALGILQAFVLLGDVPGIRRLLGLVISFAGVVILFYDPQFDDSLTAMFLALIAAFFLGLYSVMLKARHSSIAPLMVVGWSSFMGFFMILPAVFLWESDALVKLEQVSLVSWSALLFTVIGGSVVGHGTFAWLIRRQKISTVMPFMLAVPVVAVVFATILFDEAMTYQTALGVLIVLIGIGFISRSKAYR